MDLINFSSYKTRTFQLFEYISKNRKKLQNAVCRLGLVRPFGVYTLYRE